MTWNLGESEDCNIGKIMMYEVLHTSCNGLNRHAAMTRTTMTMR